MEWAVDHFGLGLMRIDPLLRKYEQKSDFDMFVSSDIDP